MCTQINVNDLLGCSYNLSSSECTRGSQEEVTVVLEGFIYIIWEEMNWSVAMTTC